MRELPEVEGVELQVVPRDPKLCVGADGSVWSCRRGRWNQLEPYTSREGYPTVAVCVALGEMQPRPVHQLVLEAFIGPCPEGMECCHWDGNPSNSRLENLRWDTSRANSADAERHGKTAKGVNAGSSKLVELQVLQIRQLASQGVPQRFIALKFGIGQPQVSNIVRRAAWKHLTSRTVNVS